MSTEGSTVEIEGGVEVLSVSYLALPRVRLRIPVRALTIWMLGLLLKSCVTLDKLLKSSFE